LILSVDVKVEKIEEVEIKRKIEFIPDQQLKDLDNKRVSIHKLIEGRPTLISFWFLACEPCKKEMKYLDEFNKKYSDSGFQVLSINTDGSRALSSVEPFVDSKKYSFKVLSDPKSLYQRKLKGTSCPFTVMVDHKGIIWSRHVGYNSGDEKKLEKEILEMIEFQYSDTLNLQVKDSLSIDFKSNNSETE
jgi:thiol-disulfide isomerase/thioredoxin